MKLSSDFRALRRKMNEVDVLALAGSDASLLLDELTPFKTVFELFYSNVAARCVDTNQHNADGAKSGADWLARKTGQSERDAASALARQKRIASNPDVAAAVASGDVSLDKADIIARESPETASSLLEQASSSTVEELQAAARSRRAFESDSAVRKRRRESQFASVYPTDDSMVDVHLRLLPELAAPFRSAYDCARDDSGWERAEDFVRLLLSESGARTTDVVFHIDVDNISDNSVDFSPVAHMKGTGPVPLADALAVLGGASLKLVGTANNKFDYFSEQDRRSNKELPDWLKRAMGAYGYDQCSTKGCPGLAEQIDHKHPRSKDGVNDPSNLQPLCEACHHAKTRQDAPWTSADVYGLTKEERKRRRQAKETNNKAAKARDGTLFGDTG